MYLLSIILAAQYTLPQSGNISIQLHKYSFQTYKKVVIHTVKPNYQQQKS